MKLYHLLDIHRHSEGSCPGVPCQVLVLCSLTSLRDVRSPGTSLTCTISATRWCSLSASAPRAWESWHRCDCLVFPTTHFPLSLSACLPGIPHCTLLACRQLLSTLNKAAIYILVMPLGAFMDLALYSLEYVPSSRDTGLKVR